MVVRPMNFPARKLRRQIRAQPDREGTEPNVAGVDELEAARAVRSKVRRTARNTK
jgi:hypothetical protein